MTHIPTQATFEKTNQCLEWLQNHIAEQTVAESKLGSAVYNALQVVRNRLPIDDEDYRDLQEQCGKLIRVTRACDIKGHSALFDCLSWPNGNRVCLPKNKGSDPLRGPSPRHSIFLHLNGLREDTGCDDV